MTVDNIESNTERKKEKNVTPVTVHIEQEI